MSRAYSPCSANGADACESADPTGTGMSRNLRPMHPCAVVMKCTFSIEWDMQTLKGMTSSTLETGPDCLRP